MKRKARHPSPEVEAALRYAESHGWRVEPGGSHAWGRMFCPTNDAICGCSEYCITSIWSTPRNATQATMLGSSNASLTDA